MKAGVLSTLFTLGLGYERGLELSAEDISMLDMNENEVTSMNLYDLYDKAILPAHLNLPASINWGPMMNPVKDQGKCGCCWAFAAADSLSARHAVKNNELIDISEKHFVDCSYPDGQKDGCQGGYPDIAWRNVARKGVAANDTYRPYNARDDPCPSDSEFDANGFKRKVFAGTNSSDPVVHQYFTGKEDMKKELFMYGPCVMYMSVDYAFPHLGKEIWRCGGTRMNHALTVVGYGRENGENYWMVKNSWGTRWGDNGFGRISMDHCELGSSTGIIFKCPEVRQVETAVADSFTFKEIAKEIGDGYCKDWIYPSTGKRSGGYDGLSSTAHGCMMRCSALDPKYSSFYLKREQCGCSKTKNGACAVKSHGAYTAYEFDPSKVWGDETFKKIGTGYCADWIYPSTNGRRGGYDNLSSTAQGCMKRCLALNPQYSSFYLKGKQCGCSTTTNGRCRVKSHSAYTAYVIESKNAPNQPGEAPNHSNRHSGPPGGNAFNNNINANK